MIDNQTNLKKLRNMRKITLSILVLLLTMVTQGARADIIPWSGNGTAGDPYLIQSSNDWDALALALTMQSTFYDKCFKLTNDISVTSMVSYYSVTNGEHPFMGTFDGDGHTLTVNITVESDNADTPAAPFAYLSGATIKNLNVAGSITTNGRRPASITSFVTGSSTITNCTSSVAITSSKEYDVDAGGFVGRVNTGSTLTLSNCLFTGSIAYTNAAGRDGGGLVGFLQTNATANLTNCVFAPTSVSFAHTYAYFNMFANGEKNGNLAPCYINITNCFYDVSNGDHWKITGQVGGTHIPATIDNNTDWQNFGTVVTCGYDYRGKTVTLGNDVSGVSTVVGTADRPFAGTFDGQGHKLTVSMSVSTGSSNTPAAPFAAIGGATIQNLHVAGSISSNAMRPASIASFVTDDSEITNCKSSVSITASLDNDVDAGGFVGRVNENKTITMTGCTFTGSINFSHTYGFEGGGMVGWTQTGASANLTNCLFAPTSVSFANSKSKADNNFRMLVGGIGSSTLTRCYYNNVAANNTKITQEGKQAYTISRGDGVAALAISDVGTTYNVSGIVVFSGGIEFNEVFYAGGDEVVNLLLAPGAAPENYHFCGYSVESGGGSIVTNLRNSATLTMADNNQIISAEWDHLASFNVTFAEGNDNEGWTIDPTFAQTLTYVTVSYAGVHKVKSVTNNVPNVELVDATHYKFRMSNFDAVVSTELWYKLDEAADNSALASKTNVFLKRTLQAGGWNTFCAPFAIADPASVFGAGVKVKQLTGASVTGNTLTLTFGNAASIAAGTPYLIKLNGEDPVDLAADGKEFAGVTQDYTAHPTTIGGVVSFVPVINPTAMTADDKTVLFVTGGNKLTYPTADGNINGFRAYFQLDGSISSARSFVLDLGDGETTSLTPVPSPRGEGSEYYSLDGRKLQGKPTTKGLYIVNGKKIVIK